MADYRFHTTWRVAAPIDDVYEVIYDAERWPSWWPGVEEVTELEPGDADGVGSLTHYVFKSRLPYKLGFDMRVIEARRPELLIGDASGELQGKGTWRFEAGAQTVVSYAWQVHTTQRWMNAVAPIVRKAFEWNHDAIMRQGGEGLSRLLGVSVDQ